MRSAERGGGAGGPAAAAGRAAPAAVRMLAAAMLVAVAGGCASILRLDAPPAGSVMELPVLGLPNARFWPDGPPDALVREGAMMAARQAAAAPAASPAAPPGAARRGLPPAHFLAISGGGDNGAFGAGLMVGWTASGTRPEFNVVTGISAGALIAPFAFLGPDYDPNLRELFTNLAPRDVLLIRGGRAVAVLLGVFGEALADTSPLYRLIERQADERMLAAIAREYGRGRLLLIGTTNLDLQRPVVWNIGAIAASGHPDALDLFRRILLASASIPGAFPPVLVDVEHGDRRHQEMHVDGGAATQVFLYPPSVDLRAAARERDISRDRTVWVVRNGRIDVEGASTSRGLFSIASRSISTLLHFSGVGDISRIYLAAVRDGLRFRLAYIGPDFAADRREPFDPAYMRALFDYGYGMGRGGEAWRSSPPVVGTFAPAPAPLGTHGTAPEWAAHPRPGGGG